MMWRPVWALIERELMRMVRQRGRLVSALVRPLIWLLVIGGGFGALLGDSVSDGYQRFLSPGLLGMVMLFAAMLVSLSVVYDKEFGHHAPADHFSPAPLLGGHRQNGQRHGGSRSCRLLGLPCSLP